MSLNTVNKDVCSQGAYALSFPFMSGKSTLGWEDSVCCTLGFQILSP